MLMVDGDHPKLWKSKTLLNIVSYDPITESEFKLIMIHIQLDPDKNTYTLYHNLKELLDHKYIVYGKAKDSVSYHFGDEFLEEQENYLFKKNSCILGRHKVWHSVMLNVPYGFCGEWYHDNI